MHPARNSRKAIRTVGIAGNARADGGAWARLCRPHRPVNVWSSGHAIRSPDGNLITGRYRRTATAERPLCAPARDGRRLCRLCATCIAGVPCSNRGWPTGRRPTWRGSSISGWRCSMTSRPKPRCPRHRPQSRRGDGGRTGGGAGPERRVAPRIMAGEGLSVEDGVGGLVTPDNIPRKSGLSARQNQCWGRAHKLIARFNIERQDRIIRKGRVIMA